MQPGVGLGVKRAEALLDPRGVNPLACFFVGDFVGGDRLSISTDYAGEGQGNEAPVPASQAEGGAGGHGDGLDGSGREPREGRDAGLCDPGRTAGAVDQDCDGRSGAEGADKAREGRGPPA